MFFFSFVFYNYFLIYNIHIKFNLKMSRLQKLSIRGIRSFSPLEDIKMEFFRPLTLIQGHNGCGKTVIIKYNLLDNN